MEHKDTGILGQLKQRETERSKEKGRETYWKKSGLLPYRGKRESCFKEIEREKGEYTETEIVAQH